MPSSISSSRGGPVRSRALRHAALFALALGAFVALECATSRVHRAAFLASRKALAAAGPAQRPLPEMTTDLKVARATLAAGTPDSVAFLGNSILASSVSPGLVAESALLRPGVPVRILTLDGASATTLLQILLESRWRPRVAFVDVSTRHLGPVAPGLVDRVVRDASDPPGPGTGPALQVRLRGATERALRERAEILYPPLRFSGDMPRRVAALADGWRFGPRVYLHSLAGNLTVVRMEDGSSRIGILHASPAIARNKAAAMDVSRGFLRRQSPGAMEASRILLDQAAILARSGTSVVLLRMPTSPSLRDLDQELNGALYASLSRSGLPVRLVDLGADPLLAGIEFYDGHHMDFTASSRASPRIGELLADLIPDALRR